MGAHEHFLFPIGLGHFGFSFEYGITICGTSSLGIGESSSPSSYDFLGVELSLDETILEAMIKNFIPLPKLEYLQDSYRINPWPKPRSGIYLENYRLQGHTIFCTIL
jgi:hypothetical protein